MSSYSWASITEGILTWGQISNLESLSKGSRNITVYFIDGTASPAITASSSGSGDTPGTGDGVRTNELVSGMILLILSLSFVAYTVYTRKLTCVKLAAVFSGDMAEKQDDGSEDIVQNCPTPEEQTDDGFDDILPESPGQA